MKEPATRGQSTIQKIWGLLTGMERRRAALLLALMLLGMMLEALGAGAAIPAIALLSQQDYIQQFPMLQPVLESFGNPSQEVLVIGGMAALVLIYLGKGIFLAFLAWRQTKFAFQVQASLSQRLFTLYLRQPYTFHLQRNSAQLIRNAVNEVQQFSGSVMIPGMQLLAESLVLIGLCVLLFLVEPIGAIVVVAVLGGASFGFHYVTRKHILRWGGERLRHDGLRFQHLQQGLGGVKDVKLLGRETEFIEQYRNHNERSARVAHLQKTIQQFPRLWLEVLAVTGMAALVLSMVAQGQSIATVLPTLGLFAAAAFRTLPSVNRLISALQSVRYGLPVVDVLDTELKMEVPDICSGNVASSPIQNILQADNIDYAYPGAHSTALKDLSIFIKRGESVGLIGPSGSGKSTLVDIILGLLPPDKGNVKVDGISIHRNPRIWQDQIGYVPQSIFLTDDSLRRNIAFGLPNSRIDEKAVMRALKAAQLENFVSALPEGLDTVVGERGIRLSGGQRQRIGIARALYHDPAVLVLDEATSSLDTATEHDVMDAVQALQGSKTIIIVAHRLSTVERCHRLYRLEGGSVVQEGEPGRVLADVAQL